MNNAQTCVMNELNMLCQSLPKNSFGILSSEGSAFLADLRMLVETKKNSKGSETPNQNENNQSPVLPGEAKQLVRHTQVGSCLYFQ